MGIGSEGHTALRLGRKFIGIELKPSYFNVAVENLRTVKGLTVDMFEDATK
jgi:DNA modification methylase